MYFFLLVNDADCKRFQVALAVIDGYFARVVFEEATMETLRRSQVVLEYFAFLGRIEGLHQLAIDLYSMELIIEI